MKRTTQPLTPEQLKLYLQSPTLFAWKIIGFKPYKYQAKWLEDDERNILIVAGRQVGKSTMLAYKALWNAFVKPMQDINIISKTLRQSKNVFDKIHQAVASTEFIEEHVQKMTLSEIIFDNGSIIRSLPAGRAGETIRGYSNTLVIFDEAAFIPEEVFIAIEPALAVKGSQVIYSSTPYGKRGFFYDTYAQQSALSPKDREFSIYRIRSDQNPLITQKFLKMERDRMTVVQFAQEYEAEFIDEAGMFYPFTLVFNCTEDYDYALPRKQSGDDRYYLGVDIAYSGEDETALVLVQEKPDKSRKMLWARTIVQKSLPATVGEIVRLSQSTRLDKIFVDKTGVGAGVYELLHQAMPSLVVGVDFTEKNRDKMYGNLKIALEKKMITISRNDRKLLHQFSSYTAKYDITGKLRLTKDTSIHDDLVDALALTFLTSGLGTFKVMSEGLDLTMGRGSQTVGLGGLDLTPFTRPPINIRYSHIDEDEQ